MEAASLAFRRSGVRLRHLSGRHAELRLLISDLRALRAAQRALAAAQQRAAQQLLRWACRDENHAVQQTAHWVAELNCLQTEALTQFNAQLKAVRYQFEMILEGEERLDACRQQLADCQTRAAKHRRELKRASGSSAAERSHTEAKLQTSERASATAQREVTERSREHEAAKTARLRQGLLTLSDACGLLAERAALVAGAQRGCVTELPELDAAELHTATYSGGRRCEERVARVKELLRLDAAGSPPRADAPPPYRASPERPTAAARSPAHCSHCGANRSPGWTDSSFSSAGGGSDYSPSAPSMPHSASPATFCPNSISPAGFLSNTPPGGHGRTIPGLHPHAIGEHLSHSQTLPRPGGYPQLGFSNPDAAGHGQAAAAAGMSRNTSGPGGQDLNVASLKLR